MTTHTSTRPAATRRSTKRHRAGFTAVALTVTLALGAAAAPAQAARDDSFAATDWKQVWKSELKKHASKTFFTKKKANKKFAAKGSSYLKAESDGRYAAAGSSYSKAESDGRYSTQTGLIRGTYALGSENNAVALLATADISFGRTLSAAPTTHFIVLGTPVPPGCSGTLDMPGADPGHLCIFDGLRLNMEEPVAATPSLTAGSTAYGTTLITVGNSASAGVALGSWAVKPLGVAAGTSSVAPEGAQLELDSLFD